MLDLPLILSAIAVVLAIRNWLVTNSTRNNQVYIKKLVVNLDNRLVKDMHDLQRDVTYLRRRTDPSVLQLISDVEKATGYSIWHAHYDTYVIDSRQYTKAQLESMLLGATARRRRK